MAIEIKELHIRVSVNTQPGASAPGGETAAIGGGDSAPDDEKEALVAACVEQVMQILQNKMER